MREKTFTAVLFISLSLLHGLNPNSSAAFSITNPQDGSAVVAGSSVTVQVDPSGVGELVAVMFTSSSPDIGMNFASKPPFEWTFQIPKGYLGELTIRAIGRVFGQREGVAPQSEVKIKVGPPLGVTLQRLRVSNDQKTLFITTGSSESFYIYGSYSDGLERRVESSATGTTYETSNPKVATVDSEGKVKAITPGKAIITVKNGSMSLQIPALVEDFK